MVRSGTVEVGAITVHVDSSPSHLRNRVSLSRYRSCRLEQLGFRRWAKVGHVINFISSPMGSVRAGMNITYCMFGNVYVALTNASNCGLTMLAANGPRFAFPEGTNFKRLSPDDFEPTGHEAADAAIRACQHLDREEQKTNPTPRQIVFAGLGEPLLRLEEMCTAIRILKARRDFVTSIRLNTNGLIQEKTLAAQKLAKAGLSSACVQIQTADPEQHRLLVRPHDGMLGLKDVTEFAQRLLENGIDVECSVVARPDVDVKAAESLTKSLGCTFKTRPYFE